MLCVSLKYQAGQPDERLYAYRYDSDNRLTTAFTSREGVIWERDAAYDYHRHAPLSRTVVGEREVQGLDYAYTLQGGIKGVNGALEGQDIGNDKNDPNLLATSKDVFGYSLGYNQQDYNPIGAANGAGFEPTNNTLTSNGLYNGNIRNILNHISDLGNIAYLYQYDPLNRISGMASNSNHLNTHSWSMETATLKYKEQVTYDANGNIKKYQRNDENGNPLDDLTYK